MCCCCNCVTGGGGRGGGVSTPALMYVTSKDEVR